MKYYKMVSGKGKVEMTEKEISELKNTKLPLNEEPSKLEVLEKKVEKISKLFDALENSDFFKTILAATERQVK